MADLKFRRTVLSLAVVAMTFTMVSADPEFDKLLKAGEYKAALDYADEKIGITDRDAAIWVKIAQANTALGLNEKALACYLVSWRLNPNDYQSLLGCALVYNNMKQPEDALNMAKKALDINFTAEASWEYAKACIALNRSAEAKSALEKVIQADPKNAIANRELGNIYYNDKAYDKAALLLVKDYSKESDGFAVYKIGKSYLEAGKTDSAIIFLKESLAKGAQSECHIDLGRAYFKVKNMKDAALSYGNVSREMLTATDLYNFASARNAAGEAADAAQLYDASIDKFGDSNSKEALLAREKSARYSLQNKQYEAALRNLYFIVQADPKGITVPEGNFLLSDVYSATNDTRNAIACLENAISLNSKNVEAYARLADLYQKSNMPDKAKQTLESMMALSPNDPGVYLSLGQYNLKAKKYSDAHSMFEKSNSLKKSADAFEGLAIAEYNLNQPALARVSAANAIKMNAESTESRIILSKIFTQEKNYREAQVQLEFIVKKRSDAEYLNMLSVCYLNNGQKDKVLEIDKKIVAMNSDDVDSRMRLAKNAEERKNYSEALDWYKELMSIKTEDASIVFKLYELSNALKDPVWSMIYLKKYIAFSPDNSEAHGYMGDLYYDDNKMDDALNEYRTALKLNPSSKGFLKRYAEIVSAKGLQDEVINALSGLITSGDADAGTFTTLGLIYEKKKMTQKAVEMYQSALQKEPSNIDALSALAGCQASLGDVNGAIISYEQIIMMNNKAVNEYKELGELYLRSFKQAEAIKTFKIYLSKDSTDFKIAKTVGNEAYKNGEFKDAQRFLGMLGNRADDQDLFEYADACVQNGDSLKAMASLEQLKSRKLKSVMQAKVCIMLVNSYEKANRFSDAVRVLGELIVLPGGKDPDNYYKRAFLTEKDNQAAAIKMYEENCKAFPADYRNFLRLGVLLSENNETISKSIEMLQRVTELGATIPSVWLELGKVYMKQGKDNNAINAFRRFAEIEPQNFDANRNLGVLLLKTNKVNEGIVYLEIANTMQSGDPVVMANLAKGYLQTNRNQEAMDLLAKVKEKAADNMEVRIALFEVYNKTGQKDKALAEIKGIADATNDYTHILLYAQCLLDAGKITEAIDAVENILAADAENVDALMMKAKSLRLDKKYEEAIEIYKEISFIRSEYAPAFFERAETHLMQSKYQWAETYYKRTLEADKNYSLAELGLARISKTRKDAAGYRLHLDNAYRLDPENALIKEEMTKGN